MSTWRWERFENGVLKNVEFQNDDKHGTHGQVFMFSSVVPVEHREAAKKGEWNRDGFTYSIGNDHYLIRYSPMF